MPFPIQIIQTDRGREFFAHSYQEILMKWGIKFRPIKSRSPHLNGKVERTHRTDLEEFYAIEDIDDPNLSEKLQEWQHYWNWERPHSALRGKSPFINGPDVWKRVLLQKSSAMNMNQQMSASDYPIIKRI